MLWRMPADTYEQRIGVMGSAQPVFAHPQPATKVSATSIWRPDTAPSSPANLRHEMAERVGFEPTVRLHAQRFSRPSRSTTLAPLRGPAYRGAIPPRQPRPDFRHLSPESGVSGVDSGGFLRIFRPPPAGHSGPPRSFVLSGILGISSANPLGMVGSVQAGRLSVRCPHDRRYPHGWKTVHGL